MIKESKLRFDDEDETAATDATDTALDTAKRELHTVVKLKKLRGNSAQKDNPCADSVSRRQQKRTIRRQYAEGLREALNQAAEGAAVEKSTRAAAASTQKAAEMARAFLRENRKPLLVAGTIAVLLMFLLSVFSSCSILIESGLSYFSSGTFFSEDEDLKGAEAAYCGMETELKAFLDSYEETHEYDSYSFDLDSIYHDPYVLLSAISAIHGSTWKLEDVGDTLRMLFDRQYILTETVNEEENAVHVKLENFDLSHVPVYIMGSHQLEMYAIYMAHLGNRPDLFPRSEYISKYITGDYIRYDVPPEALEDETFAAMLEEAEKYLGYPYVWGGSTPDTSFDCSGFVSWVVNHSGWSVGRLDAQSLCNICTPVRNPEPGDLAFFEGTYDAGVPVTHVGLYVGDNWMIHAGDPISYTQITGYLEQHLYCFGRLPTPAA